MFRNYIFTLIIAIISFLTITAQEHKITGKIDVDMLITPVDTIGDYIVYNKKLVKYNIDGKKIREKKFYINVPKCLTANLYTKSRNLVKYNFTNGIQMITVVISRDKFKNEKELQVVPFVELNDKYLKDLLKPDIMEIENDKYTGSFYKGNYLVYYYNVKQEDIELFNDAIQSIRKKE